MLFAKQSLKEETNQKRYNEQLRKIEKHTEIHTFSDQGEEAFQTAYLNREGGAALRRITSLIAVSQGKLEWNQYFVTVVGLMLIFMREF